MSKRSQNARPSAKDVDAYLADVAEPARSTLLKVRDVIRAAAPDAEETISYQMPTFRYKGKFMVSYAAFKNHCSLFPMSASFFSDHQDEFKAARADSSGKGTLRFPSDKPLPAALLKKVVKLRMQEIDADLADPS